MSDEQQHDHVHVLPLRIYFQVFGALLFLTALTVGVSLLDLGQMSLYAALAVAVVKAGLVVGFFMHLKYDDRFHSLIFFGSLFFLAVFIFIVIFIDIGARDRVLLDHGNFALRRDQQGEKQTTGVITIGGETRQTGKPPSAFPPPPKPVAVPKAMRTIKVTPQLAKRGAKIYNVECALCHGPRGEGRVGMAPRIHSDSFLAAVSDAQLIRSITKGRPGTTMIPWRTNYKKADVEALVAFVRNLNNVPPAKLDESKLDGDPQRGKQLYTRICASCHGAKGAGYQETANGTGIGRKAFLSTVTNGYLRYVIQNGKSQTRMRPFGEGKETVLNLSEQQIDDAIAYLREAAW